MCGLILTTTVQEALILVFLSRLQVTKLRLREVSNVPKITGLVSVGVAIAIRPDSRF